MWIVKLDGVLGIRYSLEPMIPLMSFTFSYFFVVIFDEVTRGQEESIIDSIPLPWKGLYGCSCAV